MQVAVALSSRTRNYNIEGPTRAQARKMATRRQELLTKAAALLATDADRAFDLDCAALDIETDLINFGFANLV